MPSKLLLTVWIVHFGLFQKDIKANEEDLGTTDGTMTLTSIVQEIPDINQINKERASKRKKEIVRKREKMLPRLVRNMNNVHIS